MKSLGQNATTIAAICVTLVIAAMASQCSFRLTPSNFGNIDSQHKRISLEGMIGLNDTSTGCWYLRTQDGTFYEPIFCLAEPIDLNQGMWVNVFGYVEPDAPQTCGIGPVFNALRTRVIAEPHLAGVK